MPIRNITIGRPEEATHSDKLKATLAEFVSTFIFVFADSDSDIAHYKITNNGAATPVGLISASIAHAFGLFVAVSVSANISGDRMNTAVIFGLAIVSWTWKTTGSTGLALSSVVASPATPLADRRLVAVGSWRLVQWWIMCV
ncbi:hypothetical protein V8G54_005273 [Vigna mungo]|uniref:Tonoplast intrinsic protein n=1 Tax=Vigna mungo TaxID=3915 RepID=A0AAQ3NWS1_VIGMU